MNTDQYNLMNILLNSN